MINIEHTSDGKIAFGVQTDNDDQQVKLLQHQLANSTVEIEKLKPEVERGSVEAAARVKLEDDLAHSSNLVDSLREQNAKLVADLAEAKKAKRRRR